MKTKNTDKILFAFGVTVLVLLILGAPFKIISLLLLLNVFYLLQERKKLIGANEKSVKETLQDLHPDLVVTAIPPPPKNHFAQADQREHKEKMRLLNLIHNGILLFVVFILFISITKWWVLLLLLLWDFSYNKNANDSGK